MRVGTPLENWRIAEKSLSAIDQRIADILGRSDLSPAEPRVLFDLSSYFTAIASTLSASADAIGQLEEDAMQTDQINTPISRRSAILLGAAVLALGILCASATPFAAQALEELPGDALAIQAKIPKLSGWLQFAFDSIWTTSLNKLVRVNVSDNSFVEIDIGGTGNFHDLGVGEGALWVPDLDRSAILKIDPATNKVTAELRAVMLYQNGNIGAGEGAVWAVTGALQKTLTRYNPTSGAVEAEIPLPSVGTFVVVDFGSIWVTGTGAGELYRIDPATNTIVGSIKLHKAPQNMCSDGESLWILNLDGLVDRVSGKSGQVVATIDTTLRSGHGGDITCGGGYAWAKMSDFSDASGKFIPGAAAVQIDPKTNTVLRRFGVAKGFGPDIEFGAGSLWISGAAVYRIEPPK